MLKKYLYYKLVVDNVKTSTNLEIELITNLFKYIYLDNDKIKNSEKFKLNAVCDKKNYHVVTSSSIKSKYNNIIINDTYITTLSKNNYLIINGKIKKEYGYLIGKVGYKDQKIKDKINFTMKFNHFFIYEIRKMLLLIIDNIIASLNYFKSTYKTIPQRIRKKKGEYIYIYDNIDRDKIVEEMIFEPLQYEIIKKYGLEVIVGNKSVYRSNPAHSFIIYTKNESHNEIISDALKIVESKFIKIRNKIKTISII
jgi:hypothetical protein